MEVAKAESVVSRSDVLLGFLQVTMAERAWCWLQWAFQDGSRNFHPLVQVTCKLFWFLLQHTTLDLPQFSPAHSCTSKTFRLPENYLTKEATFSSKFSYSFCLIDLSVISLVQNFKREEQNFVVQNEINNLSFLTGDSKTKMSKVGVMSEESKSDIIGWLAGTVCHTRSWNEMLKKN